MKQDPIEEGRVSADGTGIGTVTEEMVRNRAREIAFINGRSKNNILEADFDQARRELTGEEHLAPEPTKAESLSEEERWDPVGGSAGKKAPVVRVPDEQTAAEELVEEGVEDAEHDQMVRATKEALRKDVAG